MVEYHVVRQDVDECSLDLSDLGSQMSNWTRTSQTLPVLQAIGARYFPHNTLGSLFGASSGLISLVISGKPQQITGAMPDSTRYWLSQYTIDQLGLLVSKSFQSSASSR